MLRVFQHPARMCPALVRVYFQRSRAVAEHPEEPFGNNVRPDQALVDLAQTAHHIICASALKLTCRYGAQRISGQVERLVRHQFASYVHQNLFTLYWR